MDNNENNTSNLNNQNNIPSPFGEPTGYSDANFSNDPYASQINSNLSNLNDNTISYNNQSDNNQSLNYMPGMEIDSSNSQFNSIPGLDMNTNENNYNQMPGIDTNQNDQYNQMPGMDTDQNDQYNQMPGMDANQNDQYNQMPSMNANQNDQYNQMYGMNTNQNDQYNQMSNNSNINLNDPTQMNQYNNDQIPNYDIDYNQNNINNYDPNNMNYDQNNFNEPMPMDVPGYDQNQQYYDPNNQQNQNDTNNNTYSTTSGNSEDNFSQIWMGSLYTNANKKKFNLAAFILGPVYFLYRKVTSFGIIFTIVVTLILGILSFLTLTASNKVPFIGALGSTLLVLGIIFGSIFNGIYKGFVKSKYKIASSSNTDLNTFAKQKGGTNILGAILGAAIIIISVLGISIFGISITTNNIRNRVPNKPTTNKTTTIPTDSATPTPVNPSQNQLSDYTFTAGSDNATYKLSYNSATWTLNNTGDEKTLSLQNGDIFKYENNFIEHLSTEINASVTTDTGRKTFFDMYTQAFTQSAAQSNSTSKPSPLGFKQLSVNIYYAYNDIIGTNGTTRYYLLLIPSLDMNFQFSLTSSLQNIDETENTEVESILSSFTTPNSSNIPTSTNINSTLNPNTSATTPDSTSETSTGTTTSTTSPSTTGTTTSTSQNGLTPNQTGVEYRSQQQSPSNEITSTTSDLNSMIGSV